MQPSYFTFYYLEQQDPLVEQQLYALHYVFIPRINNANSAVHGIITALELHTKSPHQLFTAGLLLLHHAQLTAMDFFEEVDESYGLDNDGHG